MEQEKMSRTRRARPVSSMAARSSELHWGGDGLEILEVDGVSGGAERGVVVVEQEIPGLLIQQRTVHHDEGVVCKGAVQIEIACDLLFAGAGLAVYLKVTTDNI